MTRQILAFAFLCFITVSEMPALAKTGVSGLPVPRFVSLKSDKVNLRQGPGKDYAVKWIFTKIGLPVEVIAEYEHWRKVRDSKGAEGWVFFRLLSGRRTGLVHPKKRGVKKLYLYKKASKDSAIAAQLGEGVVVTIDACDGKWCNIEVLGVTGWLAQNMIWGVYRKEKIKQ